MVHQWWPGPFSFLPTRGALPPRRWALVIALLSAVLVARLVMAGPQAALQDSGDCGIDQSQSDSVTRGSKTYTARSFFQPASRTRVGGITQQDLDALASEVERLKKSACYDVCVRSLVTANGFGQACANCDFVFVVAHGDAKPPYLGLGGDSSVQLQQWPATVNASSVWIGACHGHEAASQLNGPSGSTYRSLPTAKFDKDGCALRRDMIQGLTAELATLTDTQCYYQRKKICILAAVQEVVAGP